MNLKFSDVVPSGNLLLSVVISFVLGRAEPRIVSPYNYFGLILIVAGLILAVLALSELRKNRTGVMPSESPKTLVTTGPFSFSRNPVYLGDLIVSIGAAAFFGSLAGFIGPLIFFFVVNFFAIPHEEKRLEKVFGRKFINYKKLVRRWI